MNRKSRFGVTVGVSILSLSVLLWVFDSWLAWSQHRTPGGGFILGFSGVVAGVLIINHIISKEEE